MPTTYYVSSTTDNGYSGTPSDANSGLTKALPKLTIASAQTAASSGDTIVINGGATPATNLYTASTFYNDTKGLIFQGDNFPRLTSAAAQARVFNHNTTANTKLDGLIIDGLNNATTPVTISAAATAPVLTINNCIIRDSLNVNGAGTYGISNSSSNLKLIVTNCNITGVRSAIQSVALATGYINVTDNVLTTLLASSGTEGTIRASASATGVTSYIARNTIDTTVNVSGSGANPYGSIHLSNIVALIEKNKIRIRGAGATVACIALTSEAAVAAEGSVIRWNDCRHAATTGGASGYLIIVGADATGTTADNQVNYATVYGNYLSGTAGSSPALHGILFGFIKAAYAFNNTVDYADIALIAKDTTERCVFANNVMPHSVTTGNGVLRTKGAVNTYFVGNSVVSDSTIANKAMYVTADGGTNSTGNVFAANLIYAPWALTACTTVAASQTATFLFNNYDLGTPSGNPWSYQGVTYATLAAWGAAQELTYRSLQVNFADTYFTNKLSAQGGLNSIPIGAKNPPWGV